MHSSKNIYTRLFHFSCMKSKKVGPSWFIQRGFVCPSLALAVQAARPNSLQILGKLSLTMNKYPNYQIVLTIYILKIWNWWCEELWFRNRQFWTQVTWEGYFSNGYISSYCWPQHMILSQLDYDNIMCCGQK